MITSRINNEFLSLGILFFSICLPVETRAQVGNCEPALAEAYLDAGNVRALILNNGGLFWRGGAPVYEVPKGSGSNAIFAANIWVGGLVDDELRVAASSYGPWEFWAGPLDEEGNPPNDCTAYDNIWEIRKSDILNYLQTGEISGNLLDWPVHLGAPVVDGDGILDNYNLEGGDLPELLGDQRLWWVMNDRGNIHEATDSEPIGLEVQASVHAFDHRSFAKNVTFYHYRLMNKNTSPITEAYLGLYTDIDLGNFDDDYVGSDSLLHLGFAYNSDNEDEGGYGTAPPAIGFTFLETIVSDSDGFDNDRDEEIDEPGEMLGLASVMRHYGGGGVHGDAQGALDRYNYMQGQWKDGGSILEGGAGTGGNWYWPDGRPRLPTMFSFSGNPVTMSFWSELNVDDAGTAFRHGDRQFVSSTGPFNIASGDTVNVRFAIVWSRGRDHLDSVTELKKDVKAVRRAGEFFYTPTIVELEPPSVTPSNHVFGFDQNFPNPFTQSTTIRYSLPQSMQVRLAVYDMLGREIRVLVEETQEPGIYAVDFDAERLPPGIYLARIDLDYLQFSKRMVLVQ